MINHQKIFSNPIRLKASKCTHGGKWSVWAVVWLVGWSDWVLMVVIKSDRDGRGPTRVRCQNPPHSSRPLPFNWENMESVLAVKILEQKHQPCPPPPLPPLPRKVTSDTLVSTRDKTLVPSSCCYSRPQLADETRVRIIPTFSGQFKPRMVQHVIHDMPSPARRSTLIQRWTTVKHRLAILLLQKSQSKCYRKSQNWGYIMIDKGPEIYYQRYMVFRCHNSLE